MDPEVVHLRVSKRRLQATLIQSTSNTRWRKRGLTIDEEKRLMAALTGRAPNQQRMCRYNPAASADKLEA